MRFLDEPLPVMSDDLQAVVGMAIVDRSFQRDLLANPRKAIEHLDLCTADRRAAAAITGAQSLAEYALRLEQRVLGVDHRNRVAVRRSHGLSTQPVLVAS